jgi:peptidoglycan/LPS O-acetylase OafA/YrhL
VLVLGSAAWESAFGHAFALPWFPIVACAVVGSVVRRPVAMLASAPAQWLGRVSYSLYLVNWPVIELCQRLASLRRSALPDPLVTGIGVCVSLFLAHLLYREVEEPARRALTARTTLRVGVADR